MSNNPNVTVIPATMTIHNIPLCDTTAKRLTAAYARVSTDKDEQENSFEAQVDYYTKYIAEHAEWQFVQIYTDEGISGLSTKKRDGFNAMIEDALAGRIQLIVTKSVSRFARNTVDSLNAIRKLKEKGVEVYFQKENIWSLDAKGELMLTIMSSLAQEESHSISLNTTWGQRKRFADGKVSMPYSQFLGYERGADGKPKVVESEAKTVREIYAMYLEGYTFRQICDTLTERKIPTPSGKDTWSVSTVRSILTNEKYKGEALLQKKFCADYLTKKMVKNEGQVPQYYVCDSHPAIVTAEVFDLVQAEIDKHLKSDTRRSNVSCFSGKIFCPTCGAVYCRRTWRKLEQGKPLHKRVWQCADKYKERGKVCPTTHIEEAELEAAFVKAFNMVIADKDRHIAALEPLLDLLADASAFDSEERVLKERGAGITAQIQALIGENAHRRLDQTEYNAQYSELNDRYNAVKSELARLTERRDVVTAKRHNISKFIDNLRQREGLIENFDEPLFRATVERITIHSKSSVAFIFKDGQEVSVDARLKKYCAPA